MKVKEMNRLRHMIFVEATQIEDVRNALATSDTVFIYDIREREKHRIEVLTRESQMNRKFLTDLGFNPDECRVELVMTVNRQTKTASF